MSLKYRHAQIFLLIVACSTIIFKIYSLNNESDIFNEDIQLDTLQIFKNNTIEPRNNETKLEILSYFTFPIPGSVVKRSFCNCVRINGQLNINVKYLGEYNNNDINYTQHSIRGQRIIKHILKIFSASKYINHLIKQYNTEQQKSIVILFVDAYDVMFQRNYEYILNQFQTLNEQLPEKYNNKVIWGTEKNCWPRSKNCNKFIEIANVSADTNRHLFLNAGTWIGYLNDVNAMFDNIRNYFGINELETNNVITILDKLRKDYKFPGEQGIWVSRYFDEGSRMKLDYDSNLFATVKNVSEFEWKENGWHNTITETYPSAIHFTGLTGKNYHLPRFADEVAHKLLMNDGKIDAKFPIEWINFTGESVIYKYEDICTKFRKWYH